VNNTEYTYIVSSYTYQTAETTLKPSRTAD